MLYKVVLVDDDNLVTKFMEKMIPWEERGFKVMTSFQDSEKALEYLKNNPYDVLITDISMPRMNGIELLTRLKEIKRLKKHVILSCHGEFHFAQQALKLGAFDYILKETMEEEHIIELLEKLKKELDKTSNNREYELKISKLLKANNAAFKSQFLESLMKEPVTKDWEWWKEQEELLEMDFSNKSYTVVLCFIDQFEEAIKYFETDTLLQFSINNILEEVLQKYNRDIQIFYLNNKFLLLFQRKDSKKLEVQQVVEEIMKEGHRKVESFLKISLTSVIDLGNQKSGQIVQSIQKLIKNEEQRFYYTYGSIQSFRFLPYYETSIFKSYMDVLQQLKTFILNKQGEKIDSFINKKVEEIRDRRFPPKVVRDWAMKLILDVKISLNAISYFEEQTYNSMTSKLIQKAENYQALENVLKKICQQFLQQINTIDKISKNEDVINAQKYVLSHLDKKISLKDISAFLHLNPSYFSRLFKKETGESFIEFVTRMKMEKAMELLDNTTKPVDQIALELGFDSNSYFFKTFKKTVGLSPKAYKFKINAEIERAKRTKA